MTSPDANPTNPKPPRGQSRRLRDLIILCLVLAPIALVYLLPPDTSFEEVQRAGSITACVPSSRPPLAMPGATDPGFDIALLEAITRRIGIGLTLNVIPSIGRDFNPRNWGITRAGCQIVAGGIVDAPTTRSFLEIIPTGIATGWAVVAQTDAPLQKGMKIGVYPGYGGLDRVQLSGLLRKHGMVVSLAASPDALAAGLKSGAYDAGVSESLSVRSIADANPGWFVGWLPEDAGHTSFALGLWKGDLTLKHKVVDALSALESEGFVRDLEARYAILPIDQTAAFAP
ncbi:MAG TPA: transporter substrate-binding domain-containing protein [Devosiaceae bacterium]